ncbi:MAG: Swt1 family HEPN domain-containing protein [bacterium]
MEEQNKEMKFEILALDTKGACVIKTDQNLLHSLLGNGIIWKKPIINEGNRSIIDGDLKVTVRMVSKGESNEPSYDNAFDVSVSGHIERLESFRLPLLEYMKNQHFEPLYILKDEVSECIACKIYPFLYRVENALRGYLIKFMSTRLGPKWWELTATGEWSMKVQQRKNNETVFSKHVENSAYLIDFGDLGKIIYAQSSGFTSLDHIIKKISECEETREAIADLKSQVKSNYHKFFKESFKDKGFQAKWEDLEKIRHKVAHNNLFTSDDLNKGKDLAEELITIINDASESIEIVDIPQEEKEAMRHSFIEKGYMFDVVNEDTFLSELHNQEYYFNNKGGFVGLSHFVKSVLGSNGYDYSASYDMANLLELQGKVEIYRVEDPYEGYPVTAIRTIQTPNKTNAADAKS